MTLVLQQDDGCRDEEVQGDTWLKNAPEPNLTELSGMCLKGLVLSDQGCGTLTVVVDKEKTVQYKIFNPVDVSVSEKQQEKNRIKLFAPASKYSF